jgi:hypothetical protein
MCYQAARLQGFKAVISHVSIPFPVDWHDLTLLSMMDPSDIGIGIAWQGPKRGHNVCRAPWLTPAYRLRVLLWAVCAKGGGCCNPQRALCPSAFSFHHARLCLHGAHHVSSHLKRLDPKRLCFHMSAKDLCLRYALWREP